MLVVSALVYYSAIRQSATLSRTELGALVQCDLKETMDGRSVQSSTSQLVILHQKDVKHHQLLIWRITAPPFGGSGQALQPLH